MRLADLPWGNTDQDAHAVFWSYAVIQKPGTNTWIRVSRGTEKNDRWHNYYVIQVYYGDPRSASHTKIMEYGHPFEGDGYLMPLEAQCLLYDLLRVTEGGNDAA